MSQKLKEQYILTVYSNNKSNSTNITNSNNQRGLQCWDGVFARGTYDSNKHIFKFEIRSSNENKNVEISEIPVLKELLDKLSHLFKIDKSEYNMYTIECDTIMKKILLIRFIRCSCYLSGREYLRKSMDYSSKRKKNLLYCLFMISIMENTKEYAFTDLRSVKCYREYLPDYHMYNNFLYFLNSKDKDKGKNPDNCSYRCVLRFNNLIDKKSIENIINNKSVIYHCRLISNDIKKITSLNHCINISNILGDFTNGIKNKEESLNLFKSLSKGVNVNTFKSIESFEKVYRRNNKMLLKLFNDYIPKK